MKEKQVLEVLENIRRNKKDLLNAQGAAGKWKRLSKPDREKLKDECEALGYAQAILSELKSADRVKDIIEKHAKAILNEVCFVKWIA